MRKIIFKKRELNCVENIWTNTQKKKGSVRAKWATIKVNRKWILWSNRRGTKFHLHTLGVRIIETLLPPRACTRSESAGSKS